MKKQEEIIEEEIPVNPFFDGEQPTEEVMEKIRKNPYKFIREYYESIYPYMGSQVFSVLALIPGSLIMPKISREGKEIKQKISLFLLSNPGSGKSSIAREIQKISYFPLTTLNITPARLFFEVNKREKCTLIIPDTSITLSDEELIKFLENALGEEESISRNNMRNAKEEETERHKDVVAYLSGTMELVINQRIRDGLLSRCSPLVIEHTQEQHEHMLELINGKMGKENPTKKENPIPFFYKELYEIQEGTHSKISPITGFIIPEDIKEKIIIHIKPLVKPSFNMMGVHAPRQLEQSYRYMCSHAFLNILSGERKIIDNKLVINHEDLEVAKHLIKRDIETHTVILLSINAINYYNLRTITELREWAKHRKIPQTAYAVMKGLMKK